MEHEINYHISINKYYGIDHINDALYDLIEGELDFNKRSVELIMNSEKEALKLYKGILSDGSGWVAKFGLKKDEFNNLEYWIAPNAIKVFIKVEK